MTKSVMDFYSKNLETLDNQWKHHCLSNYKGREAGDKYHSSSAFWRFVEERFESNERVRKGKS